MSRAVRATHVRAGEPSLSWREILHDYDQFHRPNEVEEIAWFREQPSLRTAIDRAAHARNRREKRYSHQTRIRRESIARATAALLAVEAKIGDSRAFDDLLRLVGDQLADVGGVGELYIYDTAFRIGAYLGFLPERVYLHAGTRAGARMLDLPYWKDALDVDELPVPLRHCAPNELEDILCIYRDRFREGGVQCSSAGCRVKVRRPRC